MPVRDYCSRKEGEALSRGERGPFFFLRGCLEGLKCLKFCLRGIWYACARSTPNLSEGLNSIFLGSKKSVTGRSVGVKKSLSRISFGVFYISSSERVLILIPPGEATGSLEPWGILGSTKSSAWGGGGRGELAGGAMAGEKCYW